MKLKPQTLAVLRLLEKRWKQGVSMDDARKMGCQALSQRIGELKRSGVKIDRKMQPHKGPFPGTHARYWIMGTKAEWKRWREKMGYYERDLKS